jgi:polysaccharide pyruvyl transferase CsaB
LHLISGGDKGGAKTHVFALLTGLATKIDVAVVCFMEGVFYKEIQNLPIRSILIKQSFRYDMRVVKKVVKLIRDERFNLVHSHGARANFISLFLKRHIGIPIITTVHSDYRLDFTQNLYKKMLFTELNAFSLRYMDYYIGVSDSFKKMLTARNFDANKIFTVYNAIDFENEIQYVSKSEFLKRYGIEENKTLIGIIGRFEKVKGHDVFIKAAALILKEYPDAVFLLAGDGDERASLERLAERLGARESVRFLGFVDDIFSFINAIDINVLSSYSESFPYALLEGARMKKATAATAVGGIPDLVINGETGYLARPADENDLAKQILKAIRNPDKRARLGENLYEYAKKNFSIDSLRNRHTDIYNKVLANEKKNNKLFDIILSGYYGFNNSGDEAILETIIARLRKEKSDVSILVLSKRPEETMRKYGVFALSRFNLLAIEKYIKRARVFVNGGGSLLQDITSSNSLVYYTFLMNLAKDYGLKVMLYANGIGPLTKSVNKRRATKALNRCDYISLRDPDSLRELKKLGVSGVKTVLSADATLNVKPITDVSEIFENENIPDKKLIGLSFRQWKFNDPRFIEKVGGIVREVNKKYGLLPVFIPMQFPQDLIISKEIAQRSGVECRVLSKRYGVKELLAIIGRMELVVSMRLHTLIYAVGINTPAIGVVYDPKIKSFLKYINQKTYLDTKNIDTTAAMEMIDFCVLNKEKIKAELKAEINALRDLCARDSRAAAELL